LTGWLTVNFRDQATSIWQRERWQHHACRIAGKMRLEFPAKVGMICGPRVE
jgi:hypothetical protein